MMSWDALGYNGYPDAQTPKLDQLAADGIRYDAAHNQDLLCTLCRNSLITGQYPRTNSFWNSGIPLVHDAETIANVLNKTGYRTGLIGKVHWEPFSSPISMGSEL
jgi:arylsulfatase A-like enzyme